MQQPKSLRADPMGSNPVPRDCQVVHQWLTLQINDLPDESLIPVPREITMMEDSSEKDS